jgi:hypothetical protein
VQIKYDLWGLYCSQAENKDVNVEIAITKYSKCKDLGVSAVTMRKKPIGQKISEYHLMLKSLDSAVLNRLKVC